MNLCRSCACCQSLHEFICASVPICLQETISLELLIVSLAVTKYLPHVPHSFLSIKSEGKRLMNIFHLELRVPGFSLSEHCEIMGFCANFYLLQEEILCCGLCKTLINEYSIMSLGVVWLLCSISRTIKLFPLTPLAYSEG